MASPCIIDEVIIGKCVLAIRGIDENAEIFHAVASNFSRVKGYIKFDLNIGVSYCKDEQTLSEPLVTNYKAVYDRESHKIKIILETHSVRDPYPSWWECAERYIGEFIKGNVKNGKWTWRRKNIT